MIANSKTTRRPWTDADNALLRQRVERDRRPFPRIAAELGRTISACRQQALKLGIYLTRPNARYGADFERFLCEKHAAGWSDTEIAEAWGGERHCVARTRRRLGLPTNQFNARHVAKVRSAAQRQLDRIGAASMAELRLLRWGADAVRRGWPADLRPREVAICEALALHGPMTRDQLAEAVGAPTHWTDPFKAGRPGGSHLAYLVREGIVDAAPRKATRKGKGRSKWLYRLRPRVRRELAPLVQQQRLYFEAIGMIEVGEQAKGKA